MRKALLKTELFPRLLVIGAMVAALSGLSGTSALAADKPEVSQADQELVASVAAGGRMYDNWIRELALKKPKQAHPLYPTEGQFVKTPWQTWRCVSCHGWDYLGDKGAFSTGDNYTGITGVSGMIGSNARGRRRRFA